MSSIKHFVISLILLAFIFTIGTFGYMIIEKWDAFDALYMTVITLTTVGYGEVHAVSSGGRVFTIIIILLGTGFSLYVAASLVQFMVEGRFRSILGRRRLDKKIDKLKDHYIICGYGRIGRVLCKYLSEDKLNMIAIEKSEDSIPVLDKDHMLYIIGNTTEETTLLKAGIKDAKGLVAALGNDADNVFLVLTAKQLNPDIFILARASLKESISKLYAAGASLVESPYERGALSMAQRILRPNVKNFLDLALGSTRKDIQMDEIPVGPNSSIKDVMLKDSGIRAKYNLIIIAIKKKDGDMIFNPSFETMIKAGDTVIALGEQVNLAELAKALN